MTNHERPTPVHAAIVLADAAAAIAGLLLPVALVISDPARWLFGYEPSGREYSDMEFYTGLAIMVVVLAILSRIPIVRGFTAGAFISLLGLGFVQVAIYYLTH